MNDRRAIRLLACTALMACLAVPAFGASPGPATRESLLLTTAQALICPDGDPSCAVAESDVEVRALVTLIVDKDSAGWDDEDFVPNEAFLEPNQGVVLPLPSDPSKSTLTLMIEFTRQGTTHVLTETYQDLGDWIEPTLNAACEGWCVPGWREPATEEQIAGVTNAGPIGIGFGWPGEALRRALNLALGLPSNALPYFAVTDTIEIFDHSAEEDTIGTVHRLKVNIKALVAAP